MPRSLGVLCVSTFALLTSAAYGQALPGGVYTAIAGMSSYAPQHKARFEVQLVSPFPVIDKNGNEKIVEKVVGRYFIQDSQWPGLKKNVVKFCKQQNLYVTTVDPGNPVVIHLQQAPPPQPKAAAEPPRRLFDLAPRK